MHWTRVPDKIRPHSAGCYVEMCSDMGSMIFYAYYSCYINLKPKQSVKLDSFENAVIFFENFKAKLWWFFSFLLLYLTNKIEKQFAHKISAML